MFQDLVDAINRLNAALDAAEALGAAQEIGTLIGGAIGYPLIKTPTEIAAMTWAEQVSWADAIQLHPPEIAPAANEEEPGL